MRYFVIHVGTRYTGEDFYEYWKCEGDIRDVWSGRLVREIMDDNAQYWYDASGAYEEEAWEDWLQDCYWEVIEVPESEYLQYSPENEWNVVIWDESYEDGDDEGWRITKVDGIEQEDENENCN